MAVSYTRTDRDWTMKIPLSFRSGFTLVELLTAIVVMGFATTIFLRLFMASVTLAEMHRAVRVAASLAEEYMTQVLTYPGEVNWSPVFEDEAANELTRVAPPESVEGPAAIPTIERSYIRTKNLYASYTREAWARIPKPTAEALDAEADPKYVEVVVVLRWIHDGREHFFSLTSTIPIEKVQESQSP